MPPLKHLSEFLTRDKLKSNDNLHHIAIDRLKNDEYVLKKWWHKKYGIPPKPLEDYTQEELLLERLEDFYLDNPSKIDEFNNVVEKDEWDGSVPRAVKDRLERARGKSKSKLEKYQSDSDKNATDEDIEKMISGLGWNLPKSRKVHNMELEFEDTF